MQPGHWPWSPTSSPGCQTRSRTQGASAQRRTKAPRRTAWRSARKRRLATFRLGRVSSYPRWSGLHRLAKAWTYGAPCRWRLPPHLQGSRFGVPQPSWASGMMRRSCPLAGEADMAANHSITLPQRARRIMPEIVVGKGFLGSDVVAVKCERKKALQVVAQGPVGQTPDHVVTDRLPDAVARPVPTPDRNEGDQPARGLGLRPLPLPRRAQTLRDPRSPPTTDRRTNLKPPA